MLTGDETGAPLDDITWSVPYKFYRLSRLRVWPTEKGIQGFEVTYTVPDDFTGYEPLVQMFGSSIDVSEFESIDITDELTGKRAFKSDGKAFRKAELYSGEQNYGFGYNLNDANVRRANGGRLIGFHTISGARDGQPQLWEIKSIAPIVDESNCELSEPNQD